MIELWKKALHEGNNIGAIFMDLPKAFDTLNHNLLFAKLNAYGFSNTSVLFIQTYLKDRHQRTNVINVLVLGLKLNPVYLKFQYWAHSSSLYLLTTYSTLSTAIVIYVIMLMIILYMRLTNCKYWLLLIYAIVNIKQLLRKNFKQLKNWFHETFMVLNPEKCHFMSLGNKSKTIFESSRNLMTVLWFGCSAPVLETTRLTQYRNELYRSATIII